MYDYFDFKVNNKTGECIISVKFTEYTPEDKEKYNWGGMSIEDAKKYLPDDTWEVIETKAWVIMDVCLDWPGVDIYARKKQISKSQNLLSDITDKGGKKIC